MPSTVALLTLILLLLLLPALLPLRRRLLARWMPRPADAAPPSVLGVFLRNLVSTLRSSLQRYPAQPHSSAGLVTMGAASHSA